MRHVGGTELLSDFNRSRPWFSFASRRSSPAFACSAIRILLSFLGFSFFSLIFLGMSANSAHAASTTTQIVPYEGFITDAAGNPLSGSINVSFRIYDDPVLSASTDLL